MVRFWNATAICKQGALYYAPLLKAEWNVAADVWEIEATAGLISLSSVSQNFFFISLTPALFYDVVVRELYENREKMGNYKNEIGRWDQGNNRWVKDHILLKFGDCNIQWDFYEDVYTILNRV